MGVSTDDVNDNRAFAEKEAFNFPLLCDTSRAICLQYGAVGDAEGIAKRISYLIDKDGTIRKAYPKVTPKTHPEEVLDDVDALTR